MSTFTRRTFLQAAGAATFVASLPPALARLTATDHRILVVIHLQGGNDGFNTVVPVDSSLYRRARPTLALRASELLPLDEKFGLHPACAGLHRLHVSGQLAIVRGVGPAETAPTNHFAGEETWETAGTGTGWLADFLADNSRRSAPAGYFAGVAAPQAFGRAGDDLSASLVVAWRRFERASAPGVSALDTDLRLVARLIAAGHPARVYWLRAGGFDTHTDQLRRHAVALAQWSNALAAFHHELESAGCAHRVATMSYSEFSRSLAENDRGGTDHGATGPVFLTGAGVAGGMHGSFSETSEANRMAGLTIPLLYSSVLTDWLCAPHAAVAGRPSLFRDSVT